MILFDGSPIPPLSGDLPVPDAVQQVFTFCVCYLFLLSLLLLVVPQKWMRRVVQIALHLRG